MLKLKVIICGDVAAGRRRLHIKAVSSHYRWQATTASGVDNKASPTGRHRWAGLFYPQEEEAQSLCKNNWKEPRSILMSSADKVAHIDGRSCNYCEQYTRFQQIINA